MVMVDGESPGTQCSVPSDPQHFSTPLPLAAVQHMSRCQSPTQGVICMSNDMKFPVSALVMFCVPDSQSFGLLACQNSSRPVQV